MLYRRVLEWILLTQSVICARGGGDGFGDGGLVNSTYGGSREALSESSFIGTTAVSSSRIRSTASVDRTDTRYSPSRDSLYRSSAAFRSFASSSVTRLAPWRISSTSSGFGSAVSGSASSITNGLSSVSSITNDLSSVSSTVSGLSSTSSIFDDVSSTSSSTSSTISDLSSTSSIVSDLSSTSSTISDLSSTSIIVSDLSSTSSTISGLSSTSSSIISPARSIVSPTSTIVSPTSSTSSRTSHYSSRRSWSSRSSGGYSTSGSVSVDWSSTRFSTYVSSSNPVSSFFPSDSWKTSLTFASSSTPTSSFPSSTVTTSSSFITSYIPSSSYSSSSIEISSVSNGNSRASLSSFYVVSSSSSIPADPSSSVVMFDDTLFSVGSFSSAYSSTTSDSGTWSQSTTSYYSPTSSHSLVSPSHTSSTVLSPVSSTTTISYASSSSTPEKTSSSGSVSVVTTSPSVTPAMSSTPLETLTSTASSRSGKSVSYSLVVLTTRGNKYTATTVIMDPPTAGSQKSTKNVGGGYWDSPGKIAGTFVPVGLVCILIVFFLIWAMFIHPRKKQKEFDTFYSGNVYSPDLTTSSPSILHSKHSSLSGFVYADEKGIVNPKTLSKQSSREETFELPRPVIVDQRLDLHEMLNNIDNGSSRVSLADEIDYSRKVLHVSNK